MGSVISFLLGIWREIDVKWALVIIAGAILTTALVITCVQLDNLEEAKVALEVSNKRLDTNNKALAIDNKKLAEDMAVSQKLLNAYGKVLGDSDLVLDVLKAKMERDKAREAVVAKKPGLVTIQTKKSYEALEREFACVSGQLEFCYQSSSSGVQQPPKSKK